jgi:leucyl aminopeptidase
MIKFSLTNEKLFEQKADCYLFFFEEDFKFSKEFENQSKKIFPNLPELMKQQKFTGKYGNTLVVPAVINNHVSQCIFLGLGKPKDKKGIAIENYRRALGQGVKQASLLKEKTIAFELPSYKLFNVSPTYLMEQTAIIIHMADYHFNDFLSDSDRKPSDITKVVIVSDAKDKKVLQKAIEEGEIIGQAVNSTRHWIDLPPNIVNPDYLVQRAREIAKKHDLKITVFNEKQVNEMGMGGLAAVSAGSEQDCHLVIMEYKTTKKNAPTVAFVGKGITFDSGGLSIKPADYMENMKDDMSGAAAVIATMGALAQLKPDINVIGVTPISENLPSGKATMPGSIVRFYNGKTAEIKNTDAEGRLILADAMAYAAKNYKLDAMIDIATLTGAVAYFLGAFYTGMLSHDEDLVELVNEASKISGERVWRLPLDEDYKAAIKTPVADLSNTGSSRYKSGTITAAWFLSNFTGDVPWVHFDIAGTAFDVPDIPYYRSGATGAGVRLLTALARNWK